MFVAFALLVGCSALAADDPPRVVEGQARFGGSDRPAAGLTLQVFHREDPARSVVVGADGRFLVSAPNGWVAPQPDGNKTPCWAIAEPPGRWQAEPIGVQMSQISPERFRSSIMDGMGAPINGTWRGGVLHLDCPEPGEVDVLVRDSRGEPLAESDIRVIPDSEVFKNSQFVRRIRFNGRTDKAGRFRMRWFEGTRQFQVEVPGVGVGSTPPIEVNGGKPTSVEALRLARFGSIAGRVASKLVAPGLNVALGVGETWQAVPCDEQGRFNFDEVPPGHYHLSLYQGNQSVRAGQVDVRVAPGGKVEGVVIDEVPPPAPGEVEREKKQKELNSQFYKPGKDALWVEGTIRDTSGRPVPGVDVFLWIAYGVIRMEWEIRQATTDASGHYAISGPIHSSADGLALVAKAKGRPPVLATTSIRSKVNERSSKLDLILPDLGTGASVSVTVLKDGKPLSGTHVYLRDKIVTYQRIGITFRGFDYALHPSVVTDPNGVAHFTDLPPGLYTAHTGGTFQDVAVSPAREAKVTMSVGRARNQMRFQVVRPDGRPGADEPIYFQFDSVGQGPRSRTLEVDGNGFGEFSFESAGLYTISARFYDASRNPRTILEAPYYEAEVRAPVSSALGSIEPIRLVGARRKKRTGTLLVRMLDVDGRPARGVVRFDGMKGSTDERGEVRFESPHERKSFVGGFLDGPDPPTWPTTGPMPADEALRGRFAYVPAVEAAVVLGRETSIELRARPVGYVRGKLKPAEGHRAADYTIIPQHDNRVFARSPRYDQATGDFLFGPLFEGPTTFHLSVKMPDGTDRSCGQRAVDVVAGEVTHVEVEPVEVKPVEVKPAAPTAAYRAIVRALTRLGIGRIVGNPEAPADAPLTVYLPDGKTPAFGALAYLYEPGRDEPAAYGNSDASGRLTWGGRWLFAVEKPTLFVRLPGRHGATIVTLDEGTDPRVVLPPAIEVEGSVKVGGRVLGDDRSLVSVVAAYQGKGILDDVLSFKLTIGPDGRFTLPGLTPGRYLVQAARDELWVSKAVELVVEPDKAIPPLSLEIPAPGRPLTLEIIDNAGQPVAGESVTLARPRGPLEAVWSPALKTDASGRLALNWLEAGPHSISLTGTTVSASFKVGEALGRPAEPTVKRITLQRPVP
ncbi:MSCRAMM family protein [Singulisphaera sp. PoT]|uniref:MSCRAMM family protein n=1 Tax=Singulisphaera sp. PoT TaxID=3411797 RepID=UPI003BF4A9C0